MNLNKYKHLALSMATSGLLLLGLFQLLNGMPPIARAASTNLFVTPGGSGNCSQATPCDLQTALGLASEGDAIYAAAGTYTGTGGAVVTVTRSVILYGGWDGSTSNPPVRDPDLHPTTLDGEGARRGVYITGPVTVTLDGLIIANGKIVSTTRVGGWNGAGLYAKDATLTLQHTRFYSNVIDVFDLDGSWSYGSGAFVEGGVLRVEACTFRGNGTWAKKFSGGGGLAIYHTLAATVTDCLFENNDAWNAGGLYFLGDSGSRSPFALLNSTFVGNGRGYSGAAYSGYAGAVSITNAQARVEGNTLQGSRASNDYGAMDIAYSDLQLARNVIYDNQSWRTSGIFLYHNSPFTVTNNIIVGNRSLYTSRRYPAVLVRGGRGQFLHNTIARNQSPYGLLVESGATVAMTNTILVSHTVGISVTADSTATMQATLWGSGAWANGTDWGGDGAIVTGTINIHGDPAFVNPDSGNYHITSGSAARNTGVNAGVSDDIDGDSRPQGSGYDIGADEFKWAIYLPLVTKP